MIELKGPFLSFLLAVFMFPLAPLVHVALMRFFKHKQQPFGFLVGGCTVYGFIWLGANLFANGFSATFWEEMIAGFSMILFFSLGYGEVFSMVCRGFSLRILIDTYLKGPLTLEQVSSNYGDGRGVDWMMKKRISNIETLGLVKWSGPWLVVASDRALLFGRFGLWFKRIFKLGPGG